jgi:uncharacterized surface protein with fasciclin (FAS1) repeats
MKMKYLTLSITAILLFVTIDRSMAQNTATSKSVEGSVMVATKDIVNNLSGAPAFSVFAALLNKGSLPAKNTPITIFAPSNKAFAKLQPGLADSLLKAQRPDSLLSLVNTHIIAGKVTSTDIARQIKLGNGQATFTTLSGERLTATLDANRNIVLTDALGKRAVVARFDIPASNGIIHTVTAVLGPVAVPVF